MSFVSGVVKLHSIVALPVLEHSGIVEWLFVLDGRTESGVFVIARVTGIKDAALCPDVPFSALQRSACNKISNLERVERFMSMRFPEV